MNYSRQKGTTNLQQAIHTYLPSFKQHDDLIKQFLNEFAVVLKDILPASKIQAESIVGNKYRHLDQTLSAKELTFQETKEKLMHD